jgi:hypothetical protein
LSAVPTVAKTSAPLACASCLAARHIDQRHGGHLHEVFTGPESLRQLGRHPSVVSEVSSKTRITSFKSPKSKLGLIFALCENRVRKFEMLSKLSLEDTLCYQISLAYDRALASGARLVLG